MAAACAAGSALATNTPWAQLSPAERRVLARPGHFMPASLIDSQFAALESPRGETLTLTLDATQPIAQLARQVDTWLKPCVEPALARPALLIGSFPAHQR